jgi:murein DD-endopeptidase MepM/ murein hydrolase activator NlpD
MQIPHSRPIRVRGRVSLVVVVLLAALVSPTWPAGARGAPVAPGPVGVWPLQPRPTVVRAFDPPDLPFGAGHRGVDLLGSPGQRVMTALGGRVTYAGLLAGRGVVVVDHGATRTTYEPVSASVKVGQLVLPGQQLGTLELFGSHCFPRACLHWGWLRGDTYLDPLLLVGAGPIRLLPLWLPVPQPSPGRGWRPPALPYAGLLARGGVVARPRSSIPPPLGPPSPVASQVGGVRSWTRPLLL